MTYILNTKEMRLIMENNIGEFENTQYVSSDNDSEKVVSIGKLVK